MERYYEQLSQLLSKEEHLDITYDPDMKVIIITTSEVMIHGITAARIYAYCAANSLRCYISWSYATSQIRLGIMKDY